MDHLPLPLDPILPLTEVPYLCGEPYDTTIPFLEYPRHKGRPWMVPVTIVDRYHDTLFPTPTSFFQTWLFFGLIAEVLGDHFNHESFVSKSEYDGSLILSTKELVSLTAQRFESVTALDKPTQKSIYLGAAQCVDLTLMTLLSATSDFNCAVKNSIASVAELLGSAVDRAHLGLFPDAVRCKTPFTANFYSNEMKTAMIAANWCPSDITRVTDKFTSTQSLYFFSKMKKPESVANHRACTTNHCLAYSTSLPQHKTRHCMSCTNESACEDITINIRLLDDILRSGALPLLQITSKDNEPSKVTVELLSSKIENARYVAISHVWADGLGNPSANSLPNCQLARLGEMLEPFVEGGRRPLVWLDTLCCPVEPKARVLALLQMRPTYAEANKTLILDSTLYNYNSQGLSAAELQARYLTSGWMRRLWTLQESALAKDPWVQFRDGPLSLLTMFDRLKKLHDDNLNHRRLLQDMWLNSQALTLHWYYTPSGAPQLSLLDRALSHRNTTVASDESLCVATLMKLDVSRILPLSSEDRMCKVWDLLAAANNGSLPRNMIFLDGPKLKRRGYGWAPSTLLPPSERFHPISSRLNRWRGLQGKPTPEGLFAEYPSYRFRPYSRLCPLPVWRVLLKMRQIRFIFKDQARDTWCALMQQPISTQSGRDQSPPEITQAPLVDLVAKGDLTIFLAEESSDDPPSSFETLLSEGIIVNVTEEKEDILHATLGGRVILMSLPPNEVIVYDAAELLMQNLYSWEIEDSKGFEGAAVMSEERIRKLKAKCKEMTRKMLAEEPRVGDAVIEMLGEGAEGWHLWGIVATWFDHVGEGWRVEGGKMWCVD